MMASRQGNCRTRAEIIPPGASIQAQEFRLLMKDSQEGVPKGGRENYLERQSRGRGLCYKAARPLWRIAQAFYNRHANDAVVQNTNKMTICQLCIRLEL